MKSKYYWLIGLTTVSTLMLGAGLASAEWHAHKTSPSMMSEDTPYLQKSKGHASEHKNAKRRPHGFSSLFQVIDSNEDRQISIQEVNEMLKARFTRLDTDNDGQVSLDEFSKRHLSMFEAVDADKNGLITRDEIKQHRRQKHAS